MLESLLQALGRLLLEGVCSATGHATLWTLTLGRWRPFENDDGIAVLTAIATWVVAGTGLWLAL